MFKIKETNLRKRSRNEFEADRYQHVVLPFWCKHLKFDKISSKEAEAFEIEFKNEEIGPENYLFLRNSIILFY
jgi:hypothetical protein